MSFFLDANVPVYAGTGDERYAEACSALISEVALGADGRTSVTVIEEVWHLELTGRVDAASGLARRTVGVLAPLLPVTHEIVAAALDLDASNLGANDRIHVATCRANGIETIVSADSAFDSVPGLTRVDPLDEKAIADLLTG